MSSTPDASMEALMDAVTRVSRNQGTSRPVLPFPFSQSQPTSLFPGLSGLLSPHPVPSHPINMSGGIMPPIRSPLNGMGGLLTNQKKLGPLRKRNHDSAIVNAMDVGASKKARIDADEGEDKKSKRLEQNRLAAIESRRRKKHMVEELHRSVQFFSKANMTLKSQNAELERQLLIAKEKVLRNEEKKAQEKETENKSAPAVKSDTLDAAAKEKVGKGNTLLLDTKPDAYPLSGSAIDLAAASNAEIEKQAKQAQFVATLALYKSMGYPVGAARAAACALSQYSDESPGINSELSFAEDKKDTSSTPESVKAADPVPQASSSELVIAEKKSPPGIACGDSAYIESLNRYAMQQAAAASAAAAAANAAIQAARLHHQLKNFTGSRPLSVAATSTSSALDMRTFPFSLYNPFQNFAGLPPFPQQKMPTLTTLFHASLGWPHQDPAFLAPRD